MKTIPWSPSSCSSPMISEAAFCQHTLRADVLCEDPAVEGTPLLHLQKERERPRGDAFAPIVLADAVTDLALPVMQKAHEITRDLPIVEDGLMKSCLVCADLRWSAI